MKRLSPNPLVHWVGVLAVGTVVAALALAGFQTLRSQPTSESILAGPAGAQVDLPAGNWASEEEVQFGKARFTPVAALDSRPCGNGEVARALVGYSDHVGGTLDGSHRTVQRWLMRGLSFLELRVERTVAGPLPSGEPSRRTTFSPADARLECGSERMRIELLSYPHGGTTVTVLLMRNIGSLGDFSEERAEAILASAR